MFLDVLHSEGLTGFLWGMHKKKGEMYTVSPVDPGVTRAPL
jgi:hypothetical protein